MHRSFVVGDLHLRKEEPFLSSAKSVLNRLVEETERGDKIIFLGDFFHTARPYPEEIKVANDFFRDCRSDSITLLAGNHGYLQNRNSFVEDVFKDRDIRFIDYPREIHDIDGDYLYLPWISGYRLNNRSLKDFYSEWLESWTPKYPESDKPLYVLYHFEDETVFAGVGEVGIDLSVIESKAGNRKVVRLGGHIHNPSKNYVGTPYVTRKDETGKISKILVKDSPKEEYKEVVLPNLIEYMDVDYDDLKSLEFEENTNYILSVLGVPNISSLYEWANRYAGKVWIDDYTLKFGDERVIVNENKDHAESIRDFLKLFIKQNKVDSDTANYMLSVF